MGDWIETTIGEFCPFEYGKGLKETDRQKGSVPVFGSNGIVGYHNQAIVESKGVIIGRKGTVGAIHYSDKPFCPIDTSFYVAESSDKDIRYIYFLLKSVDLEHMNSDSAVPGLNRTAAHSRIIEVPKSLEEQRAIAGILGALDDKIELNRRMNATLESMARAVFGERMKDEGGRMKGWEEKPLDEIANFLNGLALQKFPPEGDDYLPVIKIAQLRKNDTEGADKASTNIPPEYVIEDGDILFSWSGSLEVVVWCGGKGALNQHLFKVTSEQYPKWFYYFWTKHHLADFQEIAAGKATTMGHIQRHHLKTAKVLVPSDKELQEMNKVMSPLLDKIIVNNLESRTLASLRDGLLPKLMRGEVRVK